jgi:hypothetical protein
VAEKLGRSKKTLDYFREILFLISYLGIDFKDVSDKSISNIDSKYS